VHSDARLRLVILVLLVLLTLPAARCTKPTTSAPNEQSDTVSETIKNETIKSAAAKSAHRAVTAENAKTTPERVVPPRADEVRVELELIDHEGSEQHSFPSKTPIRLRVTLRNPSEQAVKLAFSSGRTHDAVVVDRDGRELWRWSNGRMFTQALSGMQLAPGSESSFELVCDPSAEGGAPLPAGRYTAAGVIPAFGGELHSQAVEFQVD
jgi:hypothetical protein